MRTRAGRDESNAAHGGAPLEPAAPAALLLLRSALCRAVQRPGPRGDMRVEPVVIVRGLDAEPPLDVPRGAYQLRRDEAEAPAAALRAHRTPTRRVGHADCGAATRQPPLVLGRCT